MRLVIVGAGIMGVTLATLARELNPELDITVIERLSGPAMSNSGVFNNAGTGHEANCELNYTPVDEEEIAVDKALHIHAQFNVAKQFWAYLVKQGIVEDPSSFIHSTHHCTLVAEDSIEMLRLRYKEMSKHHFFDNMTFSDSHEEIKSWIPYTMENRPESERMAATKIEGGTDVNYQAITEEMARYLSRNNVNIDLNTHVKRAHKSPTGTWLVEAIKDGNAVQYKADKLFVGAGGGAFPLLKKSHLPCRARYAGFPVGGRFLVAEIDEDAAKYYNAKTYGKAKVGAPPMSVPHLDLRAANGRHYLLFGPFATFMPVLEKGRGFVEYVRSMRFHDLPNLMNVAFEHFPLVKYLVSETFKGKESMFVELENFAPGIREKFEWNVVQAGQRVQIIKDGDLQMGTEIIISEDQSYGTLLGASPGASVSPEVMLRCIEQMMPELLESDEAKSKLSDIFVTTDLKQLMTEPKVYKKAKSYANDLLKI